MYSKFIKLIKKIKKVNYNRVLRFFTLFCIFFIFYKLIDNFNFLKLQLIENKFNILILLLLFIIYQIVLSFKNFFLLRRYVKININFTKWQKLFFTSILYNIAIAFTGTVYRAKKIKDLGVPYSKYAAMLYFNYYVYIVFVLFILAVTLIAFQNSHKIINYLVILILLFFLLLYFVPNIIINFMNKTNKKNFFFKNIIVSLITKIKTILKNNSLIYYSLFFNLCILLFEITIFFILCKIFYEGLIITDFIILFAAKFMLDILFIVGSLFSLNEVLFAIFSSALGFKFEISLFVKVAHSIFLMFSVLANLLISKIILGQENLNLKLRIKENNLENNIFKKKIGKNKKTLITVIIPYYNNKNKEIEKAINSILIQKNINFKILILIIDDCSENRVDLKKLKLVNINMNFFKIKVFRKKRNEGESKARLTGVNLSKSKYISFLDSDDFWHPKKLFIQMKFLFTTKAKVVGCDWNNNTHFSSYFNLNRDYYILNKFLLAIQWWPHISTIILERKFFYEIRANRIASLRYAGDGDLLLKLASKKTLFVLKQNLVTCHYFKKKYNSHGLSSDVQKMNRGEITVLNNNFEHKLIKLLLIVWVKFKYIVRII
jgi:glycosyltransferase involved in cell wall biosynthesis